MNKKLLSVLAVAVMASSPVFAHDLFIGETLTPVTIEDGGYSSIVDGEVEFNEWNTGVVKNGIIIAQAARPAVSEMITDKFRKAMVDAANNEVYTIVNADDAPFGAGMFISGALEEGKITNPKGHSILDEDGEVFSEWGLEEGGIAIIAVKNGKVTYVHEGRVDEAAQNEILAIIK